MIVIRTSFGPCRLGLRIVSMATLLQAPNPVQSSLEIGVTNANKQREHETSENPRQGGRQDGSCTQRKLN